MNDKTNLASGLYLISTPIGNMRDITLRALDTLKELDLLLCEDTRISKKILHTYDLQPKKILSYHAHNHKSLQSQILEHLDRKEKVGLISDAGTPLVSDPGLELVQAAIAKNIAVIPVPGASALLAALTGSGLTTHPFTFCGFPPHTAKKKRAFFENLAPVPHTLIFFESPHRLHETLKQISAVFPSQSPLTLAREISKRYEQFLHTTLEEVKDPLSKLMQTPAKGEYVLLLAPYRESKTADTFHNEAKMRRLLQKALPSQPSPSEVKAVINALHVATEVPKKIIYDLALHIQKS